MTPLLVGLDLTDRPVTVVGGGTIATRKVEQLAQAGAVVTVVSPDATADIAAAAEAGRLGWHARPYAAGDLDGAMLAVAATADGDVNATVAADADRAGVWCVRADASRHSAASFVATVARGPLQFGVATGGAAPALAAHLARQLDGAYGPEWGELAELLGELRADPQVAAALAGCDADERARRWRSVLATDTLSHLRNGDRALARKVAATCLSSPSG